MRDDMMESEARAFVRECVVIVALVALFGAAVFGWPL